MAVITPSTTVLKPQVHQTRTLETEIPPTTLSEKERNSQLLDTFLKSRRGTPFSHLVPENPIQWTTIDKKTILTLPLPIIERILSNLLTTHHPIILRPDPTTTPHSYRTHIHPTVLRVCKTLHNVGLPILYGDNTLTASSAATSVDFDKQLAALRGGVRQMVREVRLEVDWAEGLWANLPLVARGLGELRGLRGLEVVVVEREVVDVGGDVGLDIRIAYDEGCLASEGDGMVSCCRHHRRGDVGGRVEWRGKREGPLADAMLRAEMKMLRDLVGGIKGLERFRLVGYREPVFAEWLEECVRVGKHRC